MVKMFYPAYLIKVAASKPHPEGTEYWVSSGIEVIGDVNAPVTKVQMALNGKVRGRVSPAFPDGTDDLKNVLEAINKLNRAKESLKSLGIIELKGFDDDEK